MRKWLCKRRAILLLIWIGITAIYICFGFSCMDMLMKSIMQDAKDVPGMVAHNVFNQYVLRDIKGLVIWSICYLISTISIYHFIFIYKGKEQ